MTPEPTEALPTDLREAAAAMKAAREEAVDEFLREIYGHAFKEGAESTIEQWQCDQSAPPDMPHHDCENEGAYQFIEDTKPKLIALIAKCELEAGKLREALEFGDAGDALDYALDHLRDSFEIMDFLECWREGRLTDWPGYIHWLEVQRKGAAEAALSRNQGR